MQEVDETSFAPLSTRQEAGRQTRAQHLGCYGTLPVLQIVGAKASEVIFSDCEANTGYNFTCAPSTASGATPYAIIGVDKPSAARTGQGGLDLEASDVITHTLPVSEAVHYRLVWWARTTQATTFTVKVLTAGSTWFTQTVPLTSSGWQRLEVLFPDLSAITPAQRPNYTVQLLPASTVQVDDLLLLPAEATASSSTYELTLGKTSETDNRGRTQYYEYSNSGRLARVRDHNQAIVRQVEQVVAGRRGDETISPTFMVVGEKEDGEELTFYAYGPRRTDLQYEWDFGDGTVKLFGTGKSFEQHTYHTNRQTKIFAVTLKIKPSGAGSVYLGSQQLTVGAPTLRVKVDMTGVVAVDDCGRQPVSSTNGITTSTTFTAMPNLPTASYAYQWEVSRLAGGYISWSALTGATASSLTQTGTTTRSAIRCRIIDTTTEQAAVSDPVAVEHYKSDPTCSCPTCP